LVERLLSYIAGHLGTTLDTLLAGIQSNPLLLKAFCKLTLTPGIAWRSNAVRFANRHVMRTARASAIREHRSDQAWVSRSRSNRLPIIAIPTRYAGSEITPNYGLTEDDLKGMGRDLRELPKTVIYDPELSRELPPGLSFVSGLNAIAHAAEGSYAHDGNPVMSLMAEDGIRALATRLRGIENEPQSLLARSDCFCGARLCGRVLGHVGMALHHKLCHASGESFNLPHVAIILPYALASNTAASPEAMIRICHAPGGESAAHGVFEPGRGFGVPSGLGETGMQESALIKRAK
jgi:alcohol dehydrogenase class IV